MKDVECPYCGHPQDINHDDGHGYAEDQTHQQECGKCEKTFAFTTSISYYYDVEKADCKNKEADHKWWVHGLTTAECTVCGDTRGLTKEEREKQIAKYRL